MKQLVVRVVVFVMAVAFGVGGFAPGYAATGNGGGGGKDCGAGNGHGYPPRGGGATADRQTVSPGDRQTVRGTGYSPGCPVHGQLHGSRVYDLGTNAAAQDGEAVFTFTVPSDIGAGQHTVTLSGGGITESATFDVVSSGTANEGANAPPSADPTTGRNAAAGTPTGRVASALSFTGFQLAGLVALALALIGSGLMAVRIGHRRRATGL